jgi:hypothetical protein
MSELGELKQFLMTRKKWWITPIVIVLLILGAILIFSQSAAIAPLIYTLF